MIPKPSSSLPSIQSKDCKKNASTCVLQYCVVNFFAFFSSSRWKLKCFCRNPHMCFTSGVWTLPFWPCGRRDVQVLCSRWLIPKIQWGLPKPILCSGLWLLEAWASPLEERGNILHKPMNRVVLVAAETRQKCLWLLMLKFHETSSCVFQYSSL